MIDWTTVEPGLVELFSNLAFDVKPEDFSGRWIGRSQKFTSQQKKTDLFLRVRSIQDIGEDETDQAEVDVDGSPVLYNAQYGNRRVILEVRVESHQNTNTLWAWSTIERIRTRLRRPTSIAILDALNFAIVSTGPAINLPTPRDNLEWTAASFDLALLTRFEDIDMSEPFNWIAKVEITPAVVGVDGTALPDSINRVSLIDSES